jgi:molybdate transport system regulatory protein
MDLPARCPHAFGVRASDCRFRLLRFRIFAYAIHMSLSARNQFPGKVTAIKVGSVMAEVEIDIGGGHRIVSMISASSAKRLRLKKGAPATAVIKATEVIISAGDED